MQNYHVAMLTRAGVDRRATNVAMLIRLQPYPVIDAFLCASMDDVFKAQLLEHAHTSTDVAAASQRSDVGLDQALVVRGYGKNRAKQDAVPFPDLLFSPAGAT
eukprot:7085462-Pyramimonas_sp.AAC.1